MAGAMFQILGRAWRQCREFAANWGRAALMGLTTAAAVWTVWFLTKPPCPALAASNGVCNPGNLANFINVEILLAAGGGALAVSALKGGYDSYMMRIMLNQEREARQLAEEQLAEQRKRADEAQAAVTEMFNEFREEIRQQVERRQREEERHQREEERRQQEEERRQQEADERREERRIFIATQQALLDTITRLNERGNGRSNEGG